jgi:hypothetical protein
MAYWVGGLFTALGTTVQAMSRGAGDVASAAIAQSGGISISTDEIKRQLICMAIDR